jgi:glutamine cyclotransferase
MLITELKSKEAITALLSGKVFVINCHGCKEVHFPEEEANELQKELPGVTGIYTTDYIAIINPENGVVEGIVNLSGILPTTERDYKTDVLNGIAYDKATNRIFVTGKNWSKLFEIKLIAQ